MNAKDKKMLVILGVVVALIVGSILVIYHIKNDPYRVMGAVVEPMIRDISTSEWSGLSLMKYATPEFQKWLVDNNAANGMPGFSYLGKVKKFIGIRQLATDKDFDFARLTADFQFEAAPAYITLQLAKRNGRWLIYTFNVESPLFKSAPAPQVAK